MESARTPYQHPADQYFAQEARRVEQGELARQVSQQLAPSPAPPTRSIREPYASAADAAVYRLQHRQG